MKMFNTAPDRDQNIKRMVNSMIEINTCYKNGLIKKGLGAVIIQRNWQIEHNPFDGWHRSKQITYQTVEELECFKDVPINATGLDNPASWKNKNLIQLISEHGTERVISAELWYDYLWLQKPKNPRWRFFRVLLDDWNQPNAEEMFTVFKCLAKVVRL